MAERNIKKELAEAKRALRAKEQEAKKFEEDFRQTTEYKALCVEEKAAKKVWGELYPKIEQIEKRIHEDFLDGNDLLPYYTKDSTSWGPTTNIHRDVMLAIQESLKISKLRGSDIETIAKNLINRAGAKTNLPILKKQKFEASEKEHEAWTKIRALEKNNLDKKDNEVWEAKQKVRELEKELAGPTKAELVTADRDDERAKAGNSTTLSEIEQSLKKIRGAEQE